MIRIIGGEFRHRHLEIPQSEDCRPTMDKIRESVFSSLGEKVINSTFLDLFAGSGAVGLEALSRGARKVVFNEKSSQTMRTLVKNIDLFDKDRERCTTIKKDYNDAITQLAGRGVVFDIVYLDPPYALDVNDQIIERLKETGLIVPGSVVVSEQQKPLEEIPGFLLKAKKYGKKHVGMYTLI